MKPSLVALIALALALSAGPRDLSADGGVTFQDIATEAGSGLAYQRTESQTADIYREITERPFFAIFNLNEQPNKWRGAPGVALIDYDNDADLDLYVTNGPGTANSLFTNQLAQSGQLAFIDRGVAAGVAASDQDSSGVCFGDIDNDGDQDLLVVSAFDPNLLFENDGGGTFTDISASSGITKSLQTSAGCSFGDVNGDGLLDVVVANTNLDWSSVIGIGPAIPFGASWHNQLYLNTGANVFLDVSQSSGIEDLVGFPPGFDGFPSVTWGIAMVDYDLDGDIDILQADDGGAERGFNHPLRNDGTGHFTDEVLSSGLHREGNWMGFGIADFNADGYLDFAGSNVGDWNVTILSPIDPVYFAGASYTLGEKTSRWFLGGPDGTFTDPGVGDLVATPFAWGTSAADYDNDADTDIIFHGGLGFVPFVASNPGLILQNDGAANFSVDLDALATSTDHNRRNVQGMAVGDLNDDGFTDIVSVASFDIQESLPVVPYNVQWGSPLDGLIVYQQLFLPTETPGVWVYSGAEENADGSLSVEISSANNGNRWIKVETLGTVGLTAGGGVNRDGIGAVVTVSTHPRGGRTSRPVMGGSSYASQDSLELVFGLGGKPRGRIEILWPGGVRNRLYNVRHGARVLFPEIPCSFDAEWPSLFEYKQCVSGALAELVLEGVINRRQKGRFFASAIRAFLDQRRG